MTANANSTYYFGGLVNVDLNLSYPNGNHHALPPGHGCPASDPDIAGIGVVTSFLIAGIMTTSASIAAAILESIINEEHAHIFMPSFIHNMLSGRFTSRGKERCKFWRDILERLILNLADQQLITGFSLLIIGHIVQPFALSHEGRRWPSRLSLVIYLSCLSSSSHLACMLTLQRYLKEHSVLAKLRIFFIVLFAIFLSISIGLGQTFGVVGYVLSRILQDVHSKTAYKTSEYIGNGLLYGFPPLIALHVYWTAILQLMPKAQEKIRTALSAFYHGYAHVVVPSKTLEMVLGKRTSSKLRSATKATIWWLIFLNPPMIFAMQIVWANISLVFILLQKFAGPSVRSVRENGHNKFLCKGLNNPDENQWGFGQMLAMSVLVLPILAATELYSETKKKHSETMDDLRGRVHTSPSPSSSPNTSPSHSRTTSGVPLLLLHKANSISSSFNLPNPDVGPPFGRSASLRSSAVSQYTMVPSSDLHDGHADDVEARGNVGVSSEPVK